MKHTKYQFLLFLCLLLAACGPKEAAPEASSMPETSFRSGSASLPAPDVSEPDASAPDRSEPGPPAALTGEDRAAAYDAALAYYWGTVFEVDSLTEIQPRQGEISFRVSCSKGGVKQDPDRTISLERRDGVWTVSSEGY